MACFLYLCSINFKLKEFQFNTSTPKFLLFLILHSLFFILFITINSLYTTSKLNTYSYIFYGHLTLISSSIPLFFIFFSSIKSFFNFIIITRHYFLIVITLIFANHLLMNSYIIENSSIAAFSQPLKYYIFNSVYFLLRLFFEDSFFNLDTLMIGTHKFNVFLGFGCSGIQGVNIIILLTSAYYLLERKNLTIKLTTFIFFVSLGVCISLILNSLRIALLISIGAVGYEEWAIGSFHSYSGILILTFLVITFCFFINNSFSKNQFKVKLYSTLSNNIAAPYITPLLTLLSLSLLFSLFTISWDWTYPIKVIILSFLLLKFRKFYLNIINFNFSIYPILIGIFAAFLWLKIPSLAGNEQHQHSFLQSQNFIFITWITFKVIGSCILVPIIEEIAFRGFLLRFLIHKEFNKIHIGTFSLKSLIISSIIFGFLHQHLVGGFITSILFSIALYKKKSLFDAILAHSVTNIIIAYMVIFENNWSLWI